MPFWGHIVMTKGHSVQRELNYAFSHTVNMNLMHTESRINNLQKATNALLSAAPRWNYMKLLKTRDRTHSSEDCQPVCPTKNIIKSLQIYQNLIIIDYLGCGLWIKWFLWSKEVPDYVEESNHLLPLSSHHSLVLSVFMVPVCERLSSSLFHLPFGSVPLTLI